MSAIPRPPYDPQLAPALAEILAVLPQRIELSHLPVVRGLRAERIVPFEKVFAGSDIVHREVTITGHAGRPVSVTAVHSPRPVADAPLFYYIHGGGMMFGSSKEDGELYRYLVETFGAVVVAVEYGLAPENPHPAPVEDCYAGLVWAAANAAGLGADPAKIIVFGSSAGGGLAAGVTLLARDRGGPPILGQVLRCPMLDDRNRTLSSHQFDGPALWNRAYNLLGWRALLGAACGGEDVPAYAAPARATDLSRLPPAFIDVGSADLFRDEDIDYAGRIWAAGGQAELHVWAGGFHGFEMVRGAAVSDAAVTARKSWLLRLLDT